MDRENDKKTSRVSVYFEIWKVLLSRTEGKVWVWNHFNCKSQGRNGGGLLWKERSWVVKLQWLPLSNCCSSECSQAFFSPCTPYEPTEREHFKNISKIYFPKKIQEHSTEWHLLLQQLYFFEDCSELGRISEMNLVKREATLPKSHPLLLHSLLPLVLPYFSTAIKDLPPTASQLENSDRRSLSTADQHRRIVDTNKSTNNVQVPPKQVHVGSSPKETTSLVILVREALQSLF